MRRLRSGNKRPVVLVVVALAALVAGGCSDDTSVGSDDLVHGVGSGEGTRLGSQDGPAGDSDGTGDIDGTDGTGDGTLPGQGTDQPGGQPGGDTTTVAPGSTTAPPPTVSSTSAAPTTTSASTTTAAPSTTEAPARFEVAIVADGGPNQFDPRLARVFPGTVVRWTNSDSVDRSVVAADGSFSSGPIAPGGSFEWRFDAIGTFNYADGTRPYAQGTVEVVSQ